MRASIVSCVFPPEPVVSAHTSAAVAKALVTAGNTVRVITAFPNRPGGKLYAGFRRALWARDTAFSEYEVLRCFSLVSSESSMGSRFLENVSFGVFSSLALLFSTRCDVVYGNTWPIFAQGMLAVACRLRHIPLIMSVQDVYPEALAAQNRRGVFLRIAFRLLRSLDRMVKQAASAVVVISDQFKQIYVEDRRLPAAKVHLIPNWASEISPSTEGGREAMRKLHNIPKSAFLVVYAGNISLAAGVDDFIRAFSPLIAHSSIYLLIAGEGSMLTSCRKLAQSIGNVRVLFHSPWLQSETADLLAAADVFALPTVSGACDASVPSKLISYMLAGRPIIACVELESEVARIVRKANAGWVIPPANTGEISRQLLSASKYPLSELNLLGRHAREYALQQMTDTASLPKLVRLINQVVET